MSPISPGGNFEKKRRDGRAAFLRAAAEQADSRVGKNDQDSSRRRTHESPAEADDRESRIDRREDAKGQ